MPTKNNKKGHGPYIPTFFGVGLVAVICFMLLFVGVGVASATGYYVATWGSDSNPGTEDLPWRTISKAADTLVAGDTVYIKEGTYNERVIPQNSGSPGNYITYTAYPGHTVTIDGTGISVYPSGLFLIENKDYIKVSGLRIENYHPENGAAFGIYIYNGCDHIIIENNFISNTGGCGIYAYRGSSSNIIIDNNEVSHTNLDPTWDQEVISLAGVNTFEIKNNHVHDVIHIAIDAKADCKNGKIYGNLVHNVTDSVMSGSLGIYIDGAYDIDIYENVVYDISCGGIVLGLERPTWDDIKKVNIYNNIVYDSEYGVMIWPACQETIEDIEIINNDCYNNDLDGIFVGDLPIQNLTIRNNIVDGNNRYQIQIVNTGKITGLAVDHNLINGSTQYYGTDYIEGNPKFVNPVTANFHLQADSPAIDSGSSVGAPSNDFDGILRPQGAGYDIGAYEFGEAGATGTISGTVMDTTSEPIQGATVTANGYSTTTNSTGGYTITDVPVGSYTVTASATGYFLQSQENIEVLEDQTTTVDFQLTEAPDLVGLWHFDEGEGTTTVDSSGYGNNGTLVNGPVWHDGKVGNNALSFDGVDDYVDCSQGTNLNITDAITIEAWVYPTASSYDQWDAILAKGGSSYRLHMHDNQFDLGLSIVGQPNQNLDAGSVFVQNQWTHVAGTYNGTIMKIYINGTLANSIAVSGAIKTNDYPLWIGDNSQVPDRYFNGLIDEVTIYNRALSAEEIKSDYKEGVNNTYPRYDVNADGKVDILDATIVGQHFGETTNSSYPRYDINKDGKVDILDTTIVEQHFGEIAS